MRFRRGFAPFNSQPFLIFWISNLISNIATWMQQVAEPWVILSLSGSAFLLGVDSFAANVPFFALTLAGGVLADRQDRRRLILRLQAFQMLCPALIVLMLVLGHVHVWVIILLSLIVGITDALSGPAFQAIVPSLVDSKQISKAIALNSTQFNLSRLIGPVLAGLTMTGLGVTWCFGINTLSYIPFLAVIYFLRLPQQAVTLESEHDRHFPVQAYQHLLKAGQTSKMLITVAIVGMLGGPLVTFLPVLVKDVFQGTAHDFSLCLMVFGLGGLGAGAALASFTATPRVAYLGAVLLSIVMIALSFNRQFLASLLLVFLAGFFFILCNTSVNTLLQVSVQSHQRGRIASLFMLAMRGSLPAGSLLSGFTVSTLGIERALLLNGALALVLLGLLNYVVPSRRPVMVET